MEPKQLPTLAIGWDEATQNVHLGFNADQFRTWEFVIAVLEMAKMKAQEAQRMSALARLQKAEQDRRISEQIRRTIN